MSKLNLHHLNTTNWMRRVEFAAPYAKLVSPPEDDIFPAKRTIGRVYMTDGEEGQFYGAGKAGAWPYFERCLPSYQRAPYVFAHEGPNEPAMIHTVAERRALDEFTAEWSRIMREHGLRVVVGNFSERNPADGTIAEFARMLSTADYLGLHCYGAPTMQTEPEGHVLRYRQLVGELDNAMVRCPPVLLTECGVDLGIIGKGRKGWQKAGYDWATYRDGLAWYDRELCKDEIIAGAFVFTAGGTGDWVTFDISEKQAADLARTLAAQTPVAPEPAPPTEWLPEYEQGDAHTLAVKARWWNEQATRELEEGHYERADEIMVSNTKLLYRLEGML